MYRATSDDSDDCKFSLQNLQKKNHKVWSQMGIVAISNLVAPQDIWTLIVICLNDFSNKAKLSKYFQPVMGNA